MTRADVREAIDAAKEHDYLRALTLFLDIYGSPSAPSLKSPKAAEALSYFGLSLALVQKKYKEAIDLCKRSLEMEFYNADQYANLARVYMAAGNRKKAVEIAEAGLKDHPEHETLRTVRQELGVRSRPSLPFLSRDHPVNVTLGQSRHAKKQASPTKRKP